MSVQLWSSTDGYQLSLLVTGSEKLTPRSFFALELLSEHRQGCKITVSAPDPSLLGDAPSGLQDLGKFIIDNIRPAHKQPKVSAGRHFQASSPTFPTEDFKPPLTNSLGTWVPGG